MSNNKVVFLAHCNDTPIQPLNYLTCGSCDNKTWIATYGKSKFPSMSCAVCGKDAGFFGWVSDEDATD